MSLTNIEKQKEELVKEVMAQIQTSKKYRNLDPGFIKAIISQNVKEKDSKETLEERTKTKLHQVYGAYLSSLPNYEKLLSSLEANPENKEESLKNIIKFHSSTAERQEFLSDFYQKIFAITGMPKSIADLGCGLNPLAIPWMKLDPNTEYRAFDIARDQVEFLNRVFTLLGYKKAHASVSDALSSDTKKADFIFMLKLLPVLEQQREGLSKKLLEVQKAANLIVSFPTKSISQREKGMTKNYRLWFLGLLSNKPWKISEISFKNELVFIVKRLD